MALEQFNDLLKALEAGGYNAAPSTLTQGSALQTEDLSPVMELVTMEDKSIKLSKMISKKSHKSTLVQFVCQLSYGDFDNVAQHQGAVGEESVGTYTRNVVPMKYYSNVSRVSIAANMVATFDGMLAEDRESDNAAKRIAMALERHSMYGMGQFSNAGIFDGNPLACPDLPEVYGIDAQVRVSDSRTNVQDLMLSEFGANESVVLPVNGTLSQTFVEDGAVRSAMNNGAADTFIIDPIALSQYNKISHAKERIVLAGSAQEATGSNLRSQWTANDVIKFEPTRLASGKTGQSTARNTSLAGPTISLAAATDSSSLLSAGTYKYYVSAQNERGEGYASSVSSQAVAAGEKCSVTINRVAGAKFYNVYRSDAGGTSMAFIGRVKDSGASTTVFTDLGAKDPASVTGFLIQKDTMVYAELAPYSKMKLAVHDLSLPEAHFQFISLAVKQPRKNVLFDNIFGRIKK